MSKAAVPDLPGKLYIRHLTWQVVFMDASTAALADCYGSCHKESLTIRLQEGLPPDLLADVVMHEIIHALWFSQGLNHDATQTDEDLAQWLPGALALLFNDNPDFEEWWRYNRQ